MIRLEKSQMNIIAELFADVHDSLPKTCLQGYMGEAFADNSDKPASALIVVGDFCYVAGEPNESLLSFLKNYADQKEIYLIAPPDEWYEAIINVFEGRFRVQKRYALYTVIENFDKEYLERLSSTLPDGYAIERMNKVIVEQLLKEAWSKDHSSNFKDINDFLANGVGFVAVYEGKPVAAASSYTIYDNGVEIQIDTHVDHRKKGLAEAVAAALVLNCLNTGKTPCWDAANLTSEHIAKKIGFVPKGEYNCFELRIN